MFGCSGILALTGTCTLDRRSKRKQTIPQILAQVGRKVLLGAAGKPALGNPVDLFGRGKVANPIGKGCNQGQGSGKVKA